MATQLHGDLKNSIQISGSVTEKAGQGRSLFGGSKEGWWDEETGEW